MRLLTRSSRVMALLCLAGDRDVYRRRRQHAHDLVRRHRHEEPAPAAVDVDAIEIEDGAFDVDRQRLARAERRRAADLISGMTLGHGWCARGDRLAANLARQLLRRHLAVA